MTENSMEDGSKLTVEQRLAGAAQFMAESGLSAILVEGTFEDGQAYEGMSFMSRDLEEVGVVRFTDGRTVDASVEEHRRKLATAGFVNNVLRPVQQAAHTIYAEGGDLLDERFDVLPGFND